MVSSCAKGGLDWILVKISSWKGLSSIGPGYPREVVELPSLEVVKRCVDVAPGDIKEWWTWQW